MCSESSNIGLVVLDFLLQANTMRNNQAILLDSPHITAAAKYIVNQKQYWLGRLLAFACKANAKSRPSQYCF